MSLLGFFKDGKGSFGKTVKAVTDKSILFIKTITSTHEIINKGADGLNPYISKKDLVQDGVDKIISGNGIDWESGYTFTGQTYTWVKRGVTYTSEITSFTLEPAHATEFRTDAIVLTFDENGEGIMKVLPGVSGLSAVTPIPNSETELLLTTINVNPATTQPDDVVNLILYDEDENVLTANTATIDGTASGAFSGSKCIEVTNFTTGESFYIKNATDFNPKTAHSILLKVQSDSAWNNFGTIKVALIDNANNIISNEVVIDSTLVNNAGNPFAFDSGDTAWQSVNIPMIVFNPTTTIARGVVILKDDNRGTDTFKLDFIRVQSGIVTPPSLEKTKLSEFENDGENGVDPFISEQDLIDLPNVNSIQLDETPNVLTPNAGLIQWNPTEDTADLHANGVTYQLGQEIAPLVRNNTGSTIANGTPVMFAGTLGASGRVLIQLAIADGSIPSSYILGTTTEDIANGQDGHVTWFGKVRNIDTTGTPYGEVWNDSDILYVSPTTAGYLTNIKPEAPNAQIFIGVVINSHATNGTLFVRPSWRGNITDLDDVNGTTLDTDGQIIVWDDALKVFDFTKNINDYLLISDIPETSDLIDLIIAGENVVKGDHVYLSNDGKWWKTNANSKATSTTEVRVALETILADATGSALIKGSITLSGLVAGDKYWLDESAGNITNVFSGFANTSVVRYIGTAISTTKLEYNPATTSILKDGSDINGVLISGAGKPPVDKIYANIATMLADQGVQIVDYFYEVIDASADPTITIGRGVYHYLGVANGLLSDYHLEWKEEDASGGLQSIVAGQNIDVDNTDPDNPIVNNTMSLASEAHQSISTLPRQGMVSFVDDDMSSLIWTTLKPHLDAQGIKIGFGVTTDRYVTNTANTLTIAQSIQLREEGHELLAHGETHLDWGTLTEEQAESEAKVSSTFMKEVLGEHRKGMVFPYNGGGTEIPQRVVKKYFDYTFGGAHDFNIDQTIQTHQIRRIGYGLFVGPTPTPVNGVPVANTLAYYQACVDYAVSTKSWITFNLHAYETEFDQTVFNDLVDYIQGLNVPIVLPSVGNATFGSSLSIGEDVDNEILVTKTGFFQNDINILEVENPPFRITTDSASATYRPFFTMTYVGEELEWTLTDKDGIVLERRYTTSGIITDFDLSVAPVGNKYITIRGTFGTTKVTYVRINSNDITEYVNFKALKGLTWFYDVANNTNITTLDFRHNKFLVDLTLGYSPVTMVLPPETTIISGVLNYITIGNYPKTTVIKNAGKPYGLDTSPLALLTSLTLNCSNMTTEKPLDITNNPLLSYISIGAYPVTSFDLSGSPAMTEIHANASLVTTWDLSALPNLLKFYVDNGAYATIDFTANVLLQLAWIRGGVKTTITLPTTATMTEMRCDIDNNLTTINNLSNCTGMKTLHVNGSAFSAGTIDQIIIDLDANGQSNGDLDIGGQVGAVVRTAASDAAHASLLVKGWAIDVV